MKELRAFIGYANAYRLRLALLGAIMLVSSIATLALPWLAGQVAGGVIARESANLMELVGLLLLLLAFIAFLNFAVASLAGSTAARLLADLRLKIYDHLQRLPIAYHEGNRQGDTLALMTYEVARLSQFLTGTLVSVPPLLLTALGAVVLMFRIDPLLALIVPLLVPVFYVILKFLGRRLRGLAQSIQQAEADVVGIAGENLEMLPAIKAFAREDIETGRYKAKIESAMALTLQQSQVIATMSPLLGFVASSGAVLLLVFAGRNLQAGVTTPAELLTFLLYAALLTRPVSALADVYGQIQTARGTLARLQAVMGREPEPGYAVKAQLPAVQGSIRFEGVHFAYAGREEVLSGLDLHIRSGETIALMGLNGAGKSTIINLLLRLYEADKGHIKLDGRNIAEIDVRDLRRQVGVVPQRALLFNGTIHANIAYGREGATDTEIDSALRLSQAHGFIHQLPHGLDTEIGDHGVRLSGGQRQRIALARALLKNPPILVLDEATSMYDLEAEAAFIAASARALEGRTVILITHRPASVALADRIFWVKDGKAIETSRDFIPAEGRIG